MEKWRGEGNHEEEEVLGACVVDGGGVRKEGTSNDGRRRGVETDLGERGEGGKVEEQRKGKGYTVRDKPKT